MAVRIRNENRGIVLLSSYKSFLICFCASAIVINPREYIGKVNFMMKKIFRKVLVLGIVFLLCVSGSICVSAEEVPPTAEEVFPEKEVKALQEEVSRLPIYQDKTTEGEFLPSLAGVGVSYPIRKGCILVTDDKYKGILPTGHAAIIYSRYSVVESLINGVVVGANDWNTSKNTCYGLSVVGTSGFQDAEAADWCYDQLGKPYNWTFYNPWKKSEFYCSQLVWAAFYYNFDIDLSTSKFAEAIHPSELVESSNTRIIYKK